MSPATFLCLIEFALAKPQDGYFYQQDQNNVAFGNQYTAEQLQILQQYGLVQEQQLQLQQKQQQELLPRQQFEQFAQQQQFEFNPEIHLLQQQMIQLQQQQQQQQQKEQLQQEQHQQQQQQQEQQQRQEKHFLTVKKTADPLQVSEFANQLVRQAHQLIQYEQQELQEKQEQQQKQLAEKTSSVNQVYTTAEQTEYKVFEKQQESESQEQPQHYRQDQQLQPATQQIQFNSIAQPLVEQRLEIPQISQDFLVPQPTATSIQQYQIPTQPTNEHDAQTVQYNKEFFYLSAPKEESDNMLENLEHEITQLRKNIRVIFIKAPEQNVLETAALQLAKQSIESETDIYLLTKQHDLGELASTLEQVRGSSHNAKPEVIFVKYKTAEEAEQAQHSIQAQYEALGGSNNYNTEIASPNQSLVSLTKNDVQSQVDPGDAYGALHKVKSSSLLYLPAGPVKL